MKEIQTWLEDAGLDEYTELFTSNRINCDVILDLSKKDLEKLEIPIDDRKRLSRVIENFRSSCEPGSARTDEAILSNQSLPERSAQHRQLTFVFADLVDSTSMPERLDPEKYR